MPGEMPDLDAQLSTVRLLEREFPFESFDLCSKVRNNDPEAVIDQIADGDPPRTVWTFSERSSQPTSSKSAANRFARD